MRIAIIIAFPKDPAVPHGGVEAVSVSLVKALARAPETEVHVVTTDSAVTAVERSSWEGATVHRLPAARQNLLLYATGEGRRQLHDYLERLAPDVVHAHDTYGIMVRGLRRPRVFTVHGFIHEDTRYDGVRMAWLRALLWKRVELACWREQPHIVSISPYVRERLRGIATGVIHDIENPIADECFAGRARLDHPVIFSAASICERKNTLGLLAAFLNLARNHPAARLRLAGRASDPAYGKAVEDFICQHRLSERVDLLGNIPAAQVRAELAAAGVFALVSFEEGAPMGIAEAMAAGVPVVTSNRCGMPYMVRHGESGFLVEPSAPEYIANCFQRLFADADLRAQMGEQARRVALDLFHPDRVAARTFSVYREAMTHFKP